jgi:oligopeptide/dipeptide ABC transporter ATP-binding protein
MFFGRMVEVGATEDVFARPRHPYTRALLSTLDDDGGELAALEPPAPASSGGCRYRSRCPVAQLECIEHRPELQPTTDGKQQVACPYALSG